MRVSGLTVTGDWRFGKGRAVYLRRSEAIRQRVVTRLRLFVQDWFLDTEAGTDWLNLLGQPDNQARLQRAVELSVLQTEGVASITRLRITRQRTERSATVELNYTDVFNERVQVTEPVQVP